MESNSNRMGALDAALAQIMSKSANAPQWHGLSREMLDALLANAVSQHVGAGQHLLPVPHDAHRQDEARLLCVDEVCELVGVSRAKWYYLVNPRHKYFDATIPKWTLVGKRGRRWRRDEILQWANARKVEGSSK